MMGLLSRRRRDSRNRDAALVPSFQAKNEAREKAAARAASPARTATAWQDRAMSGRWWMLLPLLVGAACAIDNPGGSVAATGGSGGGSGGGTGGTGGADGGELPDMAEATPDRGPPPMEPLLTVPTCSAVPAPNELCCASALGFEDGSSQHFLTPACCRVALSTPQVVSTPTACGRAALRLDADFRVTDPSSLCGQPGEAPACAYQAGEVSRGILAPLNLTGLTLSAMVYLDGPSLPAMLPLGNLFVVGRAGLIEGAGFPIAQIGTWTRLELPFANDTTQAGVDIRVLGVRMTFNGQPWLGRAYIDEITWH
jgi:hypothetical protein